MVIMVSPPKLITKIVDVEQLHDMYRKKMKQLHFSHQRAPARVDDISPICCNQKPTIKAVGTRPGFAV